MILVFSLINSIYQVLKDIHFSVFIVSQCCLYSVILVNLLFLIHFGCFTLWNFEWCSSIGRPLCRQKGPHRIFWLIIIISCFQIAEAYISLINLHVKWANRCTFGATWAPLAFGFEYQYYSYLFQHFLGK